MLRYGAGIAPGRFFRLSSNQILRIMQNPVLKRHCCLSVVGQILFLAGFATADEPASEARHITPRSEFRNSRIRFQSDREGRVAFIGGSITEMQGYRPLVMEELQRRFPATDFEFINAGIASTCSTTGAFRLERDVLSAGDVDLLFVEYAVNDDQDAHHEMRECIRGMEGVLRKARIANPNMDIVVTHFVNPGMLQTLQDGETPLTMRSHEQVAGYYQASTIGLAAEVAERITEGTLTWEVYGGTHPKLPGNQICANMIARLLDDAWSDPLAPDANLESYPIPDEPIDAHSYFRGRFVPQDQLHLDEHWQIGNPDWSQLPGQCRDRFKEAELIHADQPSAELSVEFTGTAIGAYLLAGPDAGVLGVSIDDGPEQMVNLFHQYSRGLHYPRTVMLATDLTDAPHVLKVRIADATDAQSRGHAARIVAFVAN